jgi:DNA-binding CsgD family transcriptional regulator
MQLTLQERVAGKIEEASPYLEQIPGVVIIHYLQPSTVIYMSRNGLNRLNVTLKELQEMGTDYYERFFNLEDAAYYVPKVLGMLERNNDEETITYFQQVRATPDEEWQWHSCGTRIFMHDDKGAPYLTITLATPIDAKHFFTSKIERLLEENQFLRKSRDLFIALTKREKQILTMMAKDLSSPEMSKELHLSEDTVKTHRRNIKKKIGAQNYYDVVRFAQSFDLV